MRKTIITAKKSLAVLGLAAVMLTIPDISVQAAGIAVNAKKTMSVILLIKTITEN